MLQDDIQALLGRMVWKDGVDSSSSGSLNLMTLGRMVMKIDQLKVDLVMSRERETKSRRVNIKCNVMYHFPSVYRNMSEQRIAM